MLKFLSAALCVLTFSSEAAFARGDRGKDLVVSNFDYLGCSARGVIEASPTRVMIEVLDSCGVRGNHAVKQQYRQHGPEGWMPSPNECADMNSFDNR